MAVVDDVRPARTAVSTLSGTDSVTPASGAQRGATPAIFRDNELSRSPGSSGRSLAGYAALALAFVACPCHLPLTLGLAAAVLGGTAGTAGTVAVTQNLGTALALGAVIFIVSLAAGLWLLRGRELQAP